MKNLLKHKSTFFLLIFLLVFYNYLKNNLEIINNFKNFNFSLIFFLYFFSFLNYFSKAKINISLYKFLKLNLGLYESLMLITKSTAINLSSPANLGAGYKFHYLKKNFNLDYFDNFSINTAYAIFLNFTYIIFSYLLIIFQSTWMLYIELLVTFLILLIIFILFFLIKKLDLFSKIKNNNNYFSKFVTRFSSGFSIFKEEKQNTIKIFFDSLMYISVTTAYMYLIFSSFGFSIPIKSILLLHFLSSLIGIIKLTPGNIGFLEIVLIFFQGIHGISTNQIILFSICSRFLSFSSILLILLFEKIKSKSY